MIDAFAGDFSTRAVGSQFAAYNWRSNLLKMRTEAMPIIWHKEAMDATTASTPDGAALNFTRQPTNYFDRPGSLGRLPRTFCSGSVGLDLTLGSGITGFLDANNIVIASPASVSSFGDAQMVNFIPFESIEQVFQAVTVGGFPSNETHYRRTFDHTKYIGGKMLAVMSVGGGHVNYWSEDPGFTDNFVFQDYINADIATLVACESRFEDIKVIIYDSTRGNGYQTSSTFSGLPDFVEVRLDDNSGTAQAAYSSSGQFLADLTSFFG